MNLLDGQFDVCISTDVEYRMKDKGNIVVDEKGKD